MTFLTPHRERLRRATVVTGLLAGTALFFLAGCAGQSAFESAQAPGFIDCSKYMGTVPACTDVARMALLPMR